tara:strand:- start:52145 stop:53683 length:1539 start_codon:yes stop_codon:yes gene_type:complete
MKQIENSSGISVERLILNVAEATSNWIVDNIYKIESKKILIIIGKGNNGSDGLALAQKLLIKANKIHVYAPMGRDKDTLLTKFSMSGGKVWGISNKTSVKEFTNLLKDSDLIIDAIFGTGINKIISEPLNIYISKINESNKPIISIDIPSGMNPDNGNCDKNSVRAHTTLMLGYPKIGCVLYKNPEILGNLTVLDIGIRNIKKIKSNEFWITKKSIKKILPKRNPVGYKSIFGNVGIIAGSRKYPGAGILSTLASLHSGVGISTLISTKYVIDKCLSKIPEAIYINLPETNKNLDVNFSLNKLIPLINNSYFSSILIGPGLSVTKESELLLKDLLPEIPTNLPIILDADALNIISNIGINFKHNNNIIVTPHIGELEKLTGIKKDHIIENRLSIAKDLAIKEKINVVTKGAPTIIVSSTGEVFISPWINSGLSKAGSGDILSGLIAGLSAQKEISPIDASIIGVFVHGMAGMYTKKRFGERSMRIIDIVKEIPKSFMDIENHSNGEILVKDL